MTFSQGLSLAALVAAMFLLWNIRHILLLLFAALVLSTALCKLIEQLRLRRPMGRTKALMICLSALLGILLLTTAVVVPPFLGEFSLLLQKLPVAASTLWKLTISGLHAVNGMVYGTEAVSEWNGLTVDSLPFIPDSAVVASGLGSGLIGLLGVAGNLGSAGLQLLFVLATSLMVAVQPQAYRDVGLQLVPSFYRRRARRILLLCNEALGSWMVGVLISSLAVFVLCAMTLSMLGVKLVLANALLAGLLNVIPNVGPTLSTVFPMAVALLDAPWKAAAVLGVYVLIQNLESYVITPSVMHHQLRLLPALTLAAQVLFTLMFGPLGLLMALPLAVVMQVVIKEVVIHDVLDRWTVRKLSP